jgi:positive regulator of sigma E activity
MDLLYRDNPECNMLTSSNLSYLFPLELVYYLLSTKVFSSAGLYILLGVRYLQTSLPLDFILSRNFGTVCLLSLPRKFAIDFGNTIEG